MSGPGTSPLPGGPPGADDHWGRPASLVSFRSGSRPPETPDAVLDRIGRSSFRARFRLGEHDAAYARRHGRDGIAAHAQRFVTERLATANPDNDGRQTPMRGHPVFLAQHATATCCRGCLAKHHGIVKHHSLTDEHQAYIVAVILRWVERQLNQLTSGPNPRSSTASRRVCNSAAGQAVSGPRAVAPALF